MRLLLISDTHGHLDIIEQLAKEARADAVLHAGDFGFYDQESADRIESRELFLRVVHSKLPDEAKQRAKKLKGDALRAFIRKELPLSDFGEWLHSGRGFSVPTFAVWGNHEDGAVVAELLAGRRHIPNLTLLGTGTCGPFRFFGLGGNLLPELLGEDAPIDGRRGKIRATAREISALLDSARPRVAGEVRVLVTHVSPGKQPLVGLLAAALDVDLTVSGHMGSPHGCVWDDFAVREQAEAAARLSSAAAALPEELRARLPAPPSGEERARWYRGTFHVNLPDAPDGHAVVELKDGRLRLETSSAGLPLRA
ncbi:metallophosphoesterase family protein [Pyxidicoccus caerfyrddinensis]|uniref:metallophosphoesterase family protein n=1 Tax=Pyxidicoccus caerfyrddinensis TaxID=2709663 RepID=UPI0013DD152C|nr:metallophosphoesterase [Pyxidicoccus caerfyrddinensis]